MFVGTVIANVSVNEDWLEKIYFYDVSTPFEFKLDTGAKVNCLPVSIFNMLGVKKLESKVKLMGYNNSSIPVLGKYILQGRTKHQSDYTNMEFQIVDAKFPPVLGLKAVQSLNLIKRVHNINGNIEKEILNEYDVFQGIGEIKIAPHELTLKPDYMPGIAPPLKVPFHLQKEIEQELERLTKLKIIEKVQEPTEFVNAIVLVRKPNNKIRLCLEPQHLNKQLMREHYNIPTFEEISAKLAGGKYFTVLDAS